MKSFFLKTLTISSVIFGMVLMLSCKQKSDQNTMVKEPAEVIKKNPTRQDTIREYKRSAISKSEQKDFKGSIKDFDAALKLSPNDAVLYYYRAHSKLGINDFNGAVQDFTKAIEQDPKNSKFYNDRGIAKDNLMDYAGALKDFDIAIEKSPNDVEYYYYRGIARNHAKDKKGACADWDKASKAGYDEANDLIEENCK